MPVDRAVNRVIFHEYPESIRSAYSAALGEREPSARHKRLCELGEVALTYCASVALADYRSGRVADPDPKVEDLISRSDRLTLGRTLELFRTAQAATQGALFDLKQEETDLVLESATRFSGAIRGIEDAVELEARNLQRAVTLRLEGSLPRVGWIAFWNLFVEYRNKAEGHSKAHRWPTDNPDFSLIMAPLLEAALVEILTVGFLERIVREHPLARLVDIRVNGETFEHHFEGEDAGLPMVTNIGLDRSLTELWPESSWKAEIGKSFILDRTPSAGYEVRGPFVDLLLDGLPEPLGTVERHSDSLRTHPHADFSTSEWSVATASAQGTCGELVQGLLPDGTNFHVTCPISKSSTIRVQVRPSTTSSITGLSGEQSKLSTALTMTSEHLDLGPVEIRADHWSDLDIGKGMGSSTADILAAARALAAACGQDLPDEYLATLATSIESSDGTMFPGLVAMNHKTGDLVRQWAWWPQFIIVIVIPPTTFNTESASFLGKDSFADEFEVILDGLDTAADSCDALAFARAASRSAEINQQFVPNPYYVQLRERAAGLGALGVNVGHTGTVAGLLFPSADGMDAAANACIELQGIFPRDTRVELTTTPAWSSRS